MINFRLCQLICKLLKGFNLPLLLFNVYFFALPIAYSQDKTKVNIQKSNFFPNNTSKYQSFDAIYFTPAEKALLKDINLCDSLAYVALHNAKNNLDSSKTLRLIGRIWLYKGDYIEARKLLNISLKYLNTQSDTILLKQNILNSIGETYKEQTLYDSAMFYYRKAMDEIDGRVADTIATLLKVKLLNNISELEISQNQLSIAKITIDSALDICRNYPNDKKFNRVKAYLLETLGKYYEMLGDTSNAEHNYIESFNIRKSPEQITDNKYEYYLGMLNLGIYYKLHNKVDTSSYYNKSLHESQEFKDGIIQKYYTYLSQYARNAKTSASKIKIQNTILLLMLFFSIVLLSIIVIILTKNRQYSNNLQKLNILGNQIAKATAENDFATFVEIIYPELNALIETPIVILGIYNAQTHFLDFCGKEAGEGFVTYSSRSIDDKGSLLVESFTLEKERIINNYPISGYNPAKENEGTTPYSVAVFPLKSVNNEVIGVLSLQSFKKNSFEGNKVLLDSIATKISIAIDNMMQNELLFKSNAKLHTLVSIIKHDMQPLVKNGLDEIKQIKQLSEENNIKSISHINNLNLYLKDMNELLSIITVSNLPDKYSEFEVIFDKVNICKLLEVICSGFISAYEYSGVILELRCISYQEIYTDKRILRFIVNNFISNAFKAIQLQTIENTSLKGKIIVDVKIDFENHVLTIVVEDNGIGMELHIVSNFFDKCTKKKNFQSGEGIALKISQGLINAYNFEFSNRIGEKQLYKNLAVISSGLGKGSKFYLTLPIVI